MIINVPRRVNTLIMCKLMTLIIRGLSRISILSEVTSEVDDLIKSSSLKLEEILVHDNGISDIQDALVSLTHLYMMILMFQRMILVILSMY